MGWRDRRHRQRRRRRRRLRARPSKQRAMRIRLRSSGDRLRVQRRGCVPRGSLADCPRARQVDPRRACRQASSAQVTDGNAISSRGMLLPGEQGDLQALGTGSKARRIRRGEAGAKDHLDLADAADAEHAENAVQHDLRLGFLPGFARSTFLERFAVFQIARREGSRSRGAVRSRGGTSARRRRRRPPSRRRPSGSHRRCDRNRRRSCARGCRLRESGGRTPAWLRRWRVRRAGSIPGAADHPGTPTRAGHTDRSSSDPRGRIRPGAASPSRGRRCDCQGAAGAPVCGGWRADRAHALHRPWPILAQTGDTTDEKAARVSLVTTCGAASAIDVKNA